MINGLATAAAIVAMTATTGRRGVADGADDDADDDADNADGDEDGAAGVAVRRLSHTAAPADAAAEPMTKTLTSQGAGASNANSASTPSCGELRAGKSPAPKLPGIIPGCAGMTISRHANSPGKKNGHVIAPTAMTVAVARTHARITPGRAIATASVRQNSVRQNSSSRNAQVLCPASTGCRVGA